ncbi:VWA-like domain [Desulfitobacterium chlororespirans DSM 11544]|uniref:VWA-like domain n=1 Tax=Desulfitobacterium chlororespirans DSM 11544 TaxID=1121395 RepID=A0A1M7SHZ9_9FIRM|nr:VWA-like domain [Desulfitobacterium chlororespirans DSM 11544]
MTFPQELQAARLRLIKERPYLASAAWALRSVAKPGLGTLAVDMYWRLYYDPGVLSQWPPEIMGGVLYHEICHLLRDHPERMKSFNPKLSNLAADAEINDDLIREGVKFPVQPVTPQSIGLPDNLLAEEYYTALAGQEKSADGSPKNEQTDAPGQESDQGNSPGHSHDENGKDTHAADRTHEKDGQGEKTPVKKNSPSYKDEDLPIPGSGRCGSCATGQRAPWEEEPPGKGSTSGISPVEGELIRRDVANQIEEHVRGQGKVPGHLVRWAEEKLRPKIDWKKQLASAIRSTVADTAGATDYSYSRPSRRQGKVGQGEVILPSMRRPVPAVAIIADTSASISDPMLARTLAEISGILKALGRQEGVRVLAVDHTVQSCRRVFRPEQIRLTGGGGTDMRAGLEGVSRLRPLPQVGIVLTDGYTAWPEQPPQGMKVIVVLSGDGTAPDWAKVIQMSV